MNAREVDRLELIVTPVDPGDADAFLDACAVGRSWRIAIRTADEPAVVTRRSPLGTIDERSCLCLSLKLARPVPVEPGLRVRLVAQGPTAVEAAGVVRRWADRAMEADRD